MAPPAASDLFYTQNVQDVGGQDLDKHAAVGQAFEDAVNTPMSVSIKKSYKPVKHWEYSSHALCCLLVGKGKVKSGEIRRGIEHLPPESFAKKTYYEKWSASLAAVSLERGLISHHDLEQALGRDVSEPSVLFKAGDYVRVKPEDLGSRYRKPHLRTPGYLFGQIGLVSGPCIGRVEEPDNDAFSWVEAHPQPVYRVTFYQKDLWEGYTGTDNDQLEIEIWQCWLEPASEPEFKHQQATRATLDTGAHKKHTHMHNGHAHEHDERMEIEQKAVDAEGDDAERSRITMALVKLHIQNKNVTAEEMRSMIEELECYGSKGLGCRIVARAWVDPDFKARLLKDGATAVAELGISADGWPPGGGVTEPNGQLAGVLLKVVEDTPTKYNLLVCTLCSCYPISVLGMAPSWYKSRAFRARSVRNPRSVLKEFGTEIPEDTTIMVMDSNADTRFIKIPMRPAGTEKWTEEQLQSCVTRDSIVGVALPKTAAQVEKEGFKEPFTAGSKGGFVYQ